MYIAFLIAYKCFFIHTDGIDSRFGLSVGSLFAVIVATEYSLKLVKKDQQAKAHRFDMRMAIVLLVVYLVYFTGE